MCEKQSLILFIDECLQPKQMVDHKMKQPMMFQAKSLGKLRLTSWDKGCPYKVKT